VDEVLQLLARSVQQFHTYPPTSPLCQSAVESCQRALVLLGTREHLVFRVQPHELIVDDEPIGRGTLVEQELARRLHAASVAEVTIDRSASGRDLSRFCVDLIDCGTRAGDEVTLEDLLAEHGIDRITVRMARCPEVLEIGAPQAAVVDLARAERVRRDDQAGGAHLYPPDRGWVRLDPSCALDNISLVELALLAGDPAALAAMLLRLTDDDAAREGAEDEALASKFSDIAMIFAALDPRVARVMFGRLARAVLDLDSERRQSLLRRTILPGLLDGRVDGAVLQDFPDPDLAESLCLLLDLETAAPEVVATALTRLDLSDERRRAVEPLVEARLKDRAAERDRPEVSIERHARRLVSLDQTKGTSFAEFAGFDLSIDTHASAILDQVRAGVLTADEIAEQLHCLRHLIRLEPNPEIVQRFVDRAWTLVDALERGERWDEVAAWLARYRDLATSLQDTRPDVTDVVASSLSARCTEARAAALVDLRQRDGQDRSRAEAMLSALGPPIARALVDLIVRHGTDATGRAAAQVLVDHASQLAPALAALADHPDPVAARTVVRALGSAGPGYEASIAGTLKRPDEQIAREALRSLARLGTARAAAAVVAEIAGGRGWLVPAAEETLWRFPKAEALRHARQLVAGRDFVLTHPETAARLIDRVAQADPAAAAPLAADLSALRFRFWNPSLMRLGMKARALAGQRPS
jgi:hypothetical protein